MLNAYLRELRNQPCAGTATTPNAYLMKIWKSAMYWHRHDAKGLPYKNIEEVNHALALPRRLTPNLEINNLPGRP